MTGVELVLYHLPEVLSTVAASRDNPDDPTWTVFVAEGERDANTIEKLGLVGTCSPMGAGKWKRGKYAESLRGGRVVVLPDKDTPGRDHAIDEAEPLHGHMVSLKALELPGSGTDG